MGSPRQHRTAAAHLAPPPVARPVLANEVPRFMLLQREVEDEFRPRMLQALQHKVHTLAEASRRQAPNCSGCGHPMGYQDQPPVSWLTRFGRLRARASRYRCPACKQERRPLLEELGVEPGRVSGSLARLLALLGVVVPYELAARLAWLFFGVQVSPLSVWRAVQRLGEAAGRYSDGLSQYHADSHSESPPTGEAPSVVVLSVDGCQLGMQVRKHRRRRPPGDEPRPPLPAIEEGRFREVRTGVLLLPSERVETSPGRHGLVRRFLVGCLGDADAIFGHLWARLRELGWLGTHTVVVVVGDGAEWIWKRAPLFERRCEILDFWHALEHAWGFARLRYGEGSQQADRWVHRIAQDLRAGRVQQVIARLKTMHPPTSELRENRDALIRYYTDNAPRMRYDEYLRLGYGIGSGAVESAHKQVVHARLRQAGMRWSEAGARRLLALRLLLLNDNWRLLDRLSMISLAAS
jgi:hypothetical protein